MKKHKFKIGDYIKWCDGSLPLEVLEICEKGYVVKRLSNGTVSNWVAWESEKDWDLYDPTNFLNEEIVSAEASIRAEIWGKETK